jgi:hypothetical protein
MADNEETNSNSSNSEMVPDENKMVQLEDHAQLPEELTQDEISKMVLENFNATFNKKKYGNIQFPRSVKDDPTPEDDGSCDSVSSDSSLKISSPAAKRMKVEKEQEEITSSSDSSEGDSGDDDEDSGNSRHSMFRYTVFAKDVGKHSIRCEDEAGGYIVIKNNQSKESKVRIKFKYINELINVLQEIILKCDGVIPDEQTVEQNKI